MLIRELRDADISGAEALLQRAGLQSGEIAHWLQQRCLVAVQGEILGVAALAPGHPGFYSLLLQVEPGSRLQGIGSALWRSMLTRLPAGAEMICYACPSQNTAGQAFLLAKSFAPWFSEEVMQYPGPRLPDAGLVARPYTDADFETWTGTINQCFYPLRKANDIRPYIIFQHDQATRERLLNADSENLLFYDGDRLMGLGGIVGSEIDPVAVVAAERRKGYGRRIAAYCTNLILARGLSPVTLSVAQSNSAARQLYESVGFREVQRLQWFRLLLE